MGCPSAATPLSVLEKVGEKDNKMESSKNFNY
jgi:hypothetical protein